MTDPDPEGEKLKTLTLQIYKVVYTFLGAAPETIELSDEQCLGTSVETTGSYEDRNIAFNALGNVLAALIVSNDQPDETFNNFGENLKLTCRAFLASMGEGQTLQ